MTQIRLPSKTFLLGEYLALLGEPCLILNTAPYFILNAEKATPDQSNGIPEMSPADHFIRDHPNFFQNYQLDFFDPHHGAGGLGASSAQFLAAYLLHQQNNHKQIDIDALLNCYQHYAWNNQGIPPSGADVIAQLHGGITYFNKNQSQVETLDWPFEDYAYLLLRTGHKIATHQHLLDLDKDKIRHLPNLADEAKQHLMNHDAQGVIACIKQYNTALHQQDLLAPHTHDLLQQINQQPGVVASKGCGALGADVMLVIAQSKQLQDILQWCAAQSLAVVTHSSLY